MSESPGAIPVERVDECPLCGSAERSALARGRDYESGTCTNEWLFHRCDRCGHHWLDPRPATSALAIIYPPDYYAYNYREDINPIALRAKDHLDARKLAGVVDALGATPESFLDVGCGDGRFLRQAVRLGVPAETCYGLELDDKVVEAVRTAGLQAWNERVEDCTRFPAGSLGLITMFHVIEHVDDPVAIIARLAEWLAPGGGLVIETPNTGGLDHRMFRRRYWGGYHFPRHWNLFDVRGLQTALENAGLEVARTTFTSGHSFWMWSFHHVIAHRLRAPRLAKLFNPFKNVVFLAVFTAFDLLRAVLGRETSAVLIVACKPRP